MLTTHTQPLRIQVTWQVLEAAKDAGDEFVIAACRRVLIAHRIGRSAKADMAIVLAFAE